METEFTIMSSKGQVVIPQNIRKKLSLIEGTMFLVADKKDEIIFKKIEKPKIASWSETTKPFKEAAKKSSFTREELMQLIGEVRNFRR